MHKFNLNNIAQPHCAMPAFSITQPSISNSNQSAEEFDALPGQSTEYHPPPIGAPSNCHWHHPHVQPPHPDLPGLPEDGMYLLDMYKNSLSYMVQELATTWTNSPGDPIFLHHLYRIQIAQSLSDLDPYISLFGPCFEDLSSSWLTSLSQYLIAKLNSLFLYDTQCARDEFHRPKASPIAYGPCPCTGDGSGSLAPLRRRPTEATEYVEPVEYVGQTYPLYHCGTTRLPSSLSDDCADTAGFTSRMNSLSTCGACDDCHTIASHHGHWPMQYMAPVAEPPLAAVPCGASPHWAATTPQHQAETGLPQFGRASDPSYPTTADAFGPINFDSGQTAVASPVHTDGRAMKKNTGKALDRGSKCQGEILMLSDYAQPMKGVSFNAKKQAWLAYWTITNNFQMRKFPIKKYGFRNAKQLAIQCRLEAERQSTSERFERSRGKLALRASHPHSPSATATNPNDQ
ncbi:transcription factor with AP2 domain(s) (ApiAP2) [Babesia microti strain RI]|uniref:Transcription factor with AP2 domain(S) (ApiAP2) n=1 Tax=Babesia microti (strain RI) TaxID=1133968 RepID=I7JAN0_BABMR|nr:transcription factor with AP2 domain(s) (ApiAP2) [Babesia microti strain RI]CCF73864.1 transcription factor with AP2 domain(s) (ApiAP2) [Babesia microti strain RI]|eukprot:XP_012648473.1 transcription factor with AP2 domain(s) (ApiAP2) [Babesia microti strain RI]